MGSLTSSVFALLIFGFGILFNERGAENPEFNFTVANTFFYIAAVLQGLFCQSLNNPVSTRVKMVSAISIVLFAIAFELMRHYGTFEIRTIFMCILGSLFFIWQIYEISVKRKKTPSRQLQYLQYASSAELIFALGRIFILVSMSLSVRRLEELPQVLILCTIMQLVMNTLSYIAMGGYWAEQIAMTNARSESENKEIRSLLKERERLIASLLQANKTAATGALSASIAHELNQPLGASSLNIQFLQKKLEDGEMNVGLQKEVLDTLLSDNQRAANIIRSLRSIFVDEKISTSRINVSELVQSVLNIANPEILSKNITVKKSIESNLYLNTNRGEMQQVILNLINNAIQALADSRQTDKTISISGGFSGQDIELSIADNGDGIPVDSQSQLFELLSTGKSAGMGLGLWLCKHIVSRHGGSIWYEQNTGGGAKFVMHLPIDSSAAL